MKINELKNAFLAGDVKKPDYIKDAYSNFHNVLFEYAENLKNTDIKEISIDSNGVVFTVRSTGVKVKCQHGDHRSPPFETFNFADFEPKESKMMHKLFEGCEAFYDIGANIGWHSLNLSAKFRDAMFYCFEPIPSTYNHLLSNIKLNAFENITTFNLALSNSNSSKNYYFYEACSGNASAVDLTGREDVSTVECPQATLDAFLSEGKVPPPDFIKCDVEGAELFVFEGALETLKAHPPIVMAEILRKWSAKYGYNPNQIFDLFFSLGYHAFTSDGYQLIPFEYMNEHTVETNFFFLHSENHKNKICLFAK
jgi:FkbM family methyltransferase